MKVATLVTNKLTYSSNAFLGLFYYGFFSALKASLVAIYIIVGKNIIFTFQKQPMEGVAKYVLLK